MSPKKYVEKLIKEIDEDITNVQKANKGRNFIYNALTIFTGVLGAFTLFTNPIFGIGLLSTAAMFGLGSKRINDMLPATIKRLTDEKTSLQNRLSNGINLSNAAIARRKNAYTAAEKNFKTAKERYNNSENASAVASAATIIGTIVTGIGGGPVFGIIAVGGVLAKSIIDKNYIERHQSFETTAGVRNELLYDNNVSNMIIQRRGNTNSNTPTNSIRSNNSRTITRARAHQVRPTNNGSVRSVNNYPQNDIDAVDSYISTLEQPQDNKGGIQKRKI